MTTDKQDGSIKRARRAWLGTVSAAGGRHSRAAAGLLVLDALAAIGFAAGLAFGLAALQHGFGAMLPWLGLGFVSVMLRGAAAGLAVRTGAAAARISKAGLRDRIVRATLALPGGSRPATGALLTAAVDNIETLDGYVARFMPARAAVIGCLPILAAAALASPISAAILAGTLLPFVLIMILAGGAAADEAGRQFTALSRLGALFADRIRLLPLVLAFQAEATETARLGAAADEVRRRTMAVLRVAFLSSAGLEFFAALSVALVAVYCGFNLLGLVPGFVPERLSLGEAFFVLALAPEFYLPLRRLAAAYHDQQAAETVADGLRVLEASAPVPVPIATPITRAPRLRFSQVAIRYPGEDRPALAGFDLDVEPGRIVALVGPSGVGKTSVLNLLLGLAPLSAGDITIDGAAFPALGNIAASIAWMGQAPVIMPDTIAANIALSRPDATADELAAVARTAGLGSLLANRPEGLETRLDERGSGLSGGERQRIGLARVLLKPAPILLLDEPTAHVDAAAEAGLVAAIAQAARGRTTLIATHSERLASIADVIVRLEAA